ncbi:acyltransferase [Bacillus sp. AK031]
MKNRIESIYFLRLIAMLLVVLVHVTGTFYNTLPMEGDAFAKYHFLNRFIRIEAGIFIMLTGLVFFYNYSKKKLTVPLFIDYYKKRVLYIVVPYLVWAVLYEFYAYYTINRELVFSEVLDRILHGQSYYQLHFIFLIVQFYLVFPVLMILAKKSAFFRKYMWIIGIVIGVAYYDINSTYNLFSFKMFLSLIGPYLLGGWIGMHYAEEKRKVNKVVSTVFFGAVFLIFGSAISLLYYHLYTIQSFHLEGIYYKIINTTYLVGGSYFLFRIAERLQKKASERAMTFVRNIALYSFGFYLIHPFILREVSQIIPVHSNYLFHVEILGRYILTVFLCYAVIWTVHKFFPYPGLLFGKLPKDPPPFNLVGKQERSRIDYNAKESHGG